MLCYCGNHTACIQDLKREAEIINLLLKHYASRMLSADSRKGVPSMEEFAYEQTSPEMTNVVNTAPRRQYTAVSQDPDDDLYIA